MNPDLRRGWLWPWIFAGIFFAIPLLLFHAFPSSFWADTDYQPLGLADALNMAYRLADRQMYPARGMMGHPGVPFYLMNWLALAFVGYPVASGPGFFSTVIEHVEGYHRITVWLATLTGATGIYIIARAARNLVPRCVVATGLLIWLVSSPATLFTFVSPSVDSFAIVVNGLFLAILVRLAYDQDQFRSVAMLAACVGAFAYLNKLSYIYVPLAILAANIANLVFRKVDRTTATQLVIIAVCTFVLVVVAVGVFIIGWDGFHALIDFHKSVFLGSGLYGSGDRVVVSGSEVWRALAAIPVDRAYAIPIALVGGASLVVGGLVAGRRGPEHVPVALIGIGTGVASFLSALFVLKHYNIHYTAGVSATLPASTAACCLLAKSWGWHRRFQIVGSVLAALTVLFMAYQTTGWLISALVARTNMNEQAKADLQDISTELAGSQRAVEFAYRAPFSWYGEGFVVYYGSVPRLTDEYIGSRAEMFSSTMAGSIKRQAGAYVIDKAYFPTVESVKAASNVALLGPSPVAFKDGDKLIELRTVFLLIPG